MKLYSSVEKKIKQLCESTKVTQFMQGFTFLQKTTRGMKIYIEKNLFKIGGWFKQISVSNTSTN